MRERVVGSIRLHAGSRRQYSHWGIDAVLPRQSFATRGEAPSREDATAQGYTTPSRSVLIHEITSRIAEITSGPSAEMVERVVAALREHRDSPIEVQARAAIAAVQEVDFWRPDATTEAEAAS